MCYNGYMKNKATKFVLFILILIALVIGMGMLANKSAGPGKYDQFAQCLRDSGTKFFGAFWCPHCQTQKKAFGSSAKFLNYIECSNPDKSQTQLCIDNKIEGYPTWVFPDQSRLTGEVTFETLAEKSQCVLPKEESK